MKKLLLTTAIAVALTLPGHAAIINNLGPNPTSAIGAFSNDPTPGLFDDQFLFQLVGGPQHITIASVTNNYAAGASDFIANFQAAVYSFGIDGLFKTIDDVAVIGPTGSVACLVPSCQVIAGTATLNNGLYYLEFTGTAGATAGYGGNLSTFAVPGPGLGAGLLPGILALGGLVWLRRRKLLG